MMVEKVKLQTYWWLQPLCCLQAVV